MYSEKAVEEYKHCVIQYPSAVHPWLKAVSLLETGGGVIEKPNEKTSIGSGEKGWMH